MSNKSIEAEHRDIKEKILAKTVKQIEFAPDPFIAVDLLENHESTSACAIIDKMSPLGASIVFSVIKMRALNKTGEYNTEFYKYIVERCEKLNLNVVKGCVHARNETYRLTGVFLP